MKKILTFITLTVLLFTGQAFAKDAQQALSKTELVTQGEGVYNTYCAGCHKRDGSGMLPVFPAIIGSPIANGSAAAHIGIVRNGKGAMPAFKMLSDTDLAAVITYERNAFGNTGSVVQPSDIKPAKALSPVLEVEEKKEIKSDTKAEIACKAKINTSIFQACKGEFKKYLSDASESCKFFADEFSAQDYSCSEISDRWSEFQPRLKTQGFHFAVRMEIKHLGNNANLNHIDTSSVTKMEYLFYKSQFKGDISKWDVSNVTDMSNMFTRTYDFNSDISKWDVSNVTDMSNMFNDTSFNPDISNWDVSNVEKMDNIGNDDLKKLIIAQRQAKELKEECKKVKPISTGDICTSIYGLIAVNIKDELKNKQTPDPQKIMQLVELSEYTLDQFLACGAPTKEQEKVAQCQAEDGGFDHLLLKNLNNKKSVKKVINLSIKQCIDQEMDVANKILAKYGSNPTAEQTLDVLIENGISLSETMHCKKLSEEKPWEYAQEAAKRF